MRTLTGPEGFRGVDSYPGLHSPCQTQDSDAD